MLRLHFAFWEANEISCRLVLAILIVATTPMHSDNIQTEKLLKDVEFQLVTSTNALHYFPDVDAALRSRAAKTRYMTP